MGFFHSWNFTEKIQLAAFWTCHENVDICSRKGFPTKYGFNQKSPKKRDETPSYLPLGDGMWYYIFWPFFFGWFWAWMWLVRNRNPMCFFFQKIPKNSKKSRKISFQVLPWGDCLVDRNEREGHQSWRRKAPSRIFVPQRKFGEEKRQRWFRGFGSVGWSGEIGGAIFVIHDFWKKRWSWSSIFWNWWWCWKTQKILGDGDGGSKKGSKSIWDQQNHLYEIFYQDDFNWRLEVKQTEISWSAFL